MTTEPPVADPTTPVPSAIPEPVPAEAPTDPEIRDLATQLATPALTFDPATMLKGIITAVDSSGGAGTTPTVSVQISGDTSVTIDGVRFLGSYSPQVNDNALIVKQGTDLFALGTIAVIPAPEDPGWTAPALSAGFTTNGNNNGNVEFRKVFDNGAWKMQWRGSVAHTGTNTAITTVIAGFRPSVRRSITVARDDGGGANVVKVDFNTDGTVTLVGSTTFGNVNGGATGAASPGGLTGGATPGGTTGGAAPGGTTGTASPTGSSASAGGDGTNASVSATGTNSSTSATGTNSSTSPSGDSGPSYGNTSATDIGDTSSVDPIDNTDWQLCGYLSLNQSDLCHNHAIIGAHSHTINGNHLHSLASHTHTMGAGGQLSHGHTFTPASHTHTFTPASHTHVFTPTNHTHDITITPHSHDLTTASHIHSLTTVSHAHDLTTTAHTHTFTPTGAVATPTWISFNGIEYFL